jgi:hypothetical protein
MKYHYNIIAKDILSLDIGNPPLNMEWARLKSLYDGNYIGVFSNDNKTEIHK